ncbi:uncharacterized protein LOC141851065 [Brevipalpus obovatus]|uniref:uncharacterized protein LOC141851065 n=1 Tax=Brevipalpus obovatus TaxID=246614 RepID=UPI003D9E0D22
MKINYLLPTLLATLIGLINCQRLIGDFSDGDSYSRSNSKIDHRAVIDASKPSSHLETVGSGRKVSGISSRSKNGYPSFLLPSLHGFVVKIENDVKKNSLETDGVFLAADSATVSPAGNNLVNRQSYSEYKKSRNENSIVQFTVTAG